MSTTMGAPTMPTVEVLTVSGTVTVICELVNEYLAITPAFGMGEDRVPFLEGGFSITHRQTGIAVADGASCLGCARAASQKLAVISGWDTLTKDNGRAWAKALSPEDHETLMLFRGLEWGCDADWCSSPEPTGYVEPAA